MADIYRVKGNVVSEKSDELSMWQVAGLLRLPVRMARRWCLRKVPSEAVRREGRHLLVTMWGIREGLRRSTWQPKPRKGYQYRPGRIPVNVASRDKLGRFVSNRPPGEVRPPKRKGFVHPRRRPYIKQKD